MTLEPSDPEASAEEAGLRYVTDAVPGIRRRRAGQGLHLLGADGSRIADADASTGSAASPSRRPGPTSGSARPRGAPPGHRPRRARPQAVPLPPALARGPRRREVRAAGRVRARAAPHPPPADRDLRARGLPREKVLALVVRLLEADAHPRRQRGVRAREPLLRALDAARPPRRRCAGTRSTSRSAASRGKEHEIGVRDRRLARLVKRCQDLPGQELFQYRDDDGRASGSRPAT